MNNTRKSPSKQQSHQRPKNSYAAPASQSNRTRPTSSTGSSYPMKTTSPTALSASSSPAVPLFYSAAYADPPECSALPQPPESWFLPPNSELSPVQVEEKSQPKSSRKPNYRKNNKGFHHAFYPKLNSEKFSTPLVSVKA